MDVDQVSMLLALMAFSAAATGIAVAVLLVTGQVERLRTLSDLVLPLAFAIALVSVLGSLYYSGIQHYRPCRMCWWQRISMYPLVPVLAVGLARRDNGVAYYGLPLALIGFGWSAYHTQLRWWPPETTSCDLDAPCAAVWVDTFGFVSIPFMALCGFAAIAALLATSMVLQRTPANQAEAAAPVAVS